MYPGDVVKLREDYHLGEELRNPTYPHLYCNPRKLIDCKQHYMIIATNSECDDMLIMTKEGNLGWIDKFRLILCK